MTSPGQQGRFDGFDVLAQSTTWDRVTAGVVLGRLAPPAPLRFFTEPEGAAAAALLDQLLGQHEPPRIDLLAALDARLALEMTDGWHYADMPRDGDAWRQSLAALDAESAAQHEFSFTDLDRVGRDTILITVQDLIDQEWRGLPARHVWSLWTRYACAAFYSHPWAWNEIGFGGPAYPRGYKNLGLDAREPWERPEREPRDPIPGQR